MPRVSRPARSYEECTAPVLWLARSGESSAFPRRHRRCVTVARKLTFMSLSCVMTSMREDWFFNIMREGQLDVTPHELQLQWRTVRDREFIGRDALEAQRALGIHQRVVTLACEGAASETSRVSSASVSASSPTPAAPRRSRSSTSRGRTRDRGTLSGAGMPGAASGLCVDSARVHRSGKRVHWSRREAGARALHLGCGADVGPAAE